MFASIEKGLTALVLLACMLVGGVGFVTGYTLGSDKTSTKYETKILTQQAQAAKDLAEQKTYLKEQHEKASATLVKEIQVAQEAARSARNAVDSLQQQLSTAKQRLASASHQSTTKYAVTVTDVLGQCTKRYQELGEAASGHVADIKMMCAAGL